MAHLRRVSELVGHGVTLAQLATTLRQERATRTRRATQFAGYGLALAVVVLWWGSYLLTEAAPAPGAAQPNSTQPNPEQWRYLTAYDCSRPSQVEAVRLPIPGSCPRPDVNVTGKDPKTFLVLQKAQFLRFPAKVCRMWDSRIPEYCGHYSHQTLLAKSVRIRRPVTLSEAECQRMIDEGTYSYQGKAIGGIKMNMTTQRTIELRGETVIGHSNQVDCYGTQRSQEGLYNLVDVRVLEFELSQVWLTRDELGHVTTARSAIRLPCEFHRHKCRGRTGTYLWDPSKPTDDCPLHKVRHAQGHVYHDSDGGATFISGDDTAVRLLLGREIFLCGKPVTETEHDRVFVTTHLDDPDFQRNLDPMELSAVLHSSIQSGYIESKLANHVEEVIADLKQETCEVRSTHLDGRYDQLVSQQRSSVLGETAALGGGRFATGRGEAWYTYGCAKVIARAEDKPKCYNALPVSISSTDLEAHLAARGEAQFRKFEFFVEPVTKRLLTAAAEMACDPVLRPMFQNAQGGWLFAGPQVIRAPTPHQLVSLSNALIQSQYSHTNLAKGGLYTAEQIKTMDLTRQLPNIVDDIEATMAKTASESGWSQGSQATLSSYDVLATSGPWYLDPFGKIMSYLNKSYYLATWITALGFIFKVLTWAWGVVTRFRYGPAHPGMTRRQHWMNVLFPSAVYGFFRQWREERQRLEEDDPDLYETTMQQTERGLRERGDGHDPRRNEDLWHPEQPRDPLAGMGRGASPPPEHTRRRPRAGRSLPAPPSRSESPGTAPSAPDPSNAPYDPLARSLQGLRQAQEVLQEEELAGVHQPNPGALYANRSKDDRPQ